MEFDSVQVGVADLEAATRDYETLLGISPTHRTPVLARFALVRGAVELEGGEPGLHSLRFTAARPEAASTWPNRTEAFNGLDIRMTSRHAEAAGQGAPDGAEGIDHVVIQSPNLDRAVALWRDQLGVRLALDREFPARGLRMLFFRSAGVTLEFVGALAAATTLEGPDRFYGVAYTVRDLDAYRSRLLRAGVHVSEVRQGQKRGTIVATVRSGSAGVPTLLVQTTT